MTALEAEAVATALGFDPLLIALHGDSDVAPNPQSVIQAYIETRSRSARCVSG